MKIYPDYPLTELNTFAVCTTAKAFCRLREPNELKGLRSWQYKHQDLPVLLLGGGSNVLFAADYPGLVVRIELRERQIIAEDGDYIYVRAGAGENWHDFVRWTIDQGLAGLENLSLIPGTVGAAPMQNIGAYGVELKDVFHELVALDWRTMEWRHFNQADCCFAYRDSYFKSVEPGRWLITSVVFRLPRKPQWRLDYAGVREQLEGKELSARCISDAVIALRRSKLPDPAVIGNAGSFFKNPLLAARQWEALRQNFTDIPGWPQADGQVKTSAGWLIDQCGWKGKRAGDAGTYEQHALVLVNHGQASGAELWAFAQQIIASVRERFGIELEPEPCVLN